MATIVDVTGATYPSSFDGHAVEPLEGQSLLPVFGKDTTGDDRKPMFWEHEGNAAVRIGKWKLVKRYPRAWELYDMDADRTELQRPRVTRAGAGQGDGGAVRRVGEALRRARPGEGRGADEGPGGDAGVLGEGRGEA